MSYILSINSKPQMHFKTMTNKKNSNEDGIISNRMESGRPNYFTRWEDVLYDLTLQVLTKDELKKIRKEIGLSMINDGSITLDNTKLSKAGWFDFAELNGSDPHFYVTAIPSQKRINGTDLWNLTINLSERIPVVI